MKRWTIWIEGSIMGTYPGSDEADALAEYAKELPSGSTVPKMASGKVRIEEVKDPA